MIRKIHQVWIQGESHFQQTQPVYYEYSKQFHILFPTFKYKLWSEQDALALFPDNLKQSYLQAPNFACKADIIRYFVLYQVGGLYADTDYEPFKNCEYLFDDVDLCCVAMHLTKNKLLFGNFKYNNAWIYSLPNHLIFKNMLDTIIANPFDSKKYSKFDYTWQITGPKAFGNNIDDLKLTSDPKVRILPHNMVEVADFSCVALVNLKKEDILLQYPYALGLHHCGGSWVKNSHVIKKVFGSFYTFITSWNDFVNIFLVLLILLIPIIILIIWAVKRKSHRRT